MPAAFNCARDAKDLEYHLDIHDGINWDAYSGEWRENYDPIDERLYRHKGGVVVDSWFI